MVNNRNIALTREMLITNVWGYDFVMCDNCGV